MAIAKRVLFGFCFAFGIASSAHAEGWEIKQPSGATNLLLIYKGQGQASYRFECSPTEVIVTEIGVTDILDFRTNTKVDDTPGSTMAPGAALMALATGSDDAPNLGPAEAAPNAVRGWDMTIRLPKKDKALRAFAKARMVSLFTTGYTMAVALDDVDTQTIRSFLSQCGIKS
jgi:hypothetical protein